MHLILKFSDLLTVNFDQVCTKIVYVKNLSFKTHVFMGFFFFKGKIQAPCVLTGDPSSLLLEKHISLTEFNLEDISDWLKIPLKCGRIPMETNGHLSSTVDSELPLHK